MRHYPENASRFDLSEEAAAQLRLFQKIPAGHYFVLGTIVRIQDSRTFGFVEIQAIEGIVVFKIAPFKEIGKVKKSLSQPFKSRALKLSFRDYLPNNN